MAFEPELIAAATIKSITGRVDAASEIYLSTCAVFNVEHSKGFLGGKYVHQGEEPRPVSERSGASSALGFCYGAIMHLLF
jgi:hypothetical protein